ncbi:histone-lysine N-methyltransferase setd3 [Pelomyxa schiedti]|nr:histone-lysine N-methyltransferase setd3 [Pelomyxa schiedti]
MSHDGGEAHPITTTTTTQSGDREDLLVSVLQQRLSPQSGANSTSPGPQPTRYNTPNDFKFIFDALQALVLYQSRKYPQALPLAPSGDSPLGKSVVDEFLKWFSSKGGVLNNATIGLSFPEGNGLLATAPIPEGTLVVQVPSNAMITETTALDSPISSLIGTGISRSSPSVLLALYLLHEKSKPSSQWAPYLSMLPKSYGTPLYFTWQELSALEGSPAFSECCLCIRSTAMQYCHLLGLFKNNQEVIAPQFLTFSEYAWAMSVVLTRQNRIPRPSSPMEIAPDPSMIALIPMWDMCNHCQGKVTTFLNFETRALEMFSLREFPCGSQIYMNYGIRTNAQLLVNSGFVYNDNTDDTLLVPESEIPSQQGLYGESSAAIQRVKLLQQCGLQVKPGSIQSLSFNKKGLPNTDLQVYLNVVSLGDETVLSGKITAREIMASPMHAKLVPVLCSKLLARYPTSIKDDVSNLKTIPPNQPNMRNIVTLLLSEKKILLTAMQAAQEICRDLVPSPTIPPQQPPSSTTATASAPSTQPTPNPTSTTPKPNKKRNKKKKSAHSKS